MAVEKRAVQSIADAIEYLADALNARRAGLVDALSRIPNSDTHGGVYV